MIRKVEMLDCLDFLLLEVGNCRSVFEKKMRNDNEVAEHTGFGAR